MEELLLEEELFGDENSVKIRFEAPLGAKTAQGAFSSRKASYCVVPDSRFLSKLYL